VVSRSWRRTLGGVPGLGFVPIVTLSSSLSVSVSPVRVSLCRLLSFEIALLLGSVRGLLSTGSYLPGCYFSGPCLSRSSLSSRFSRLVGLSILFSGSMSFSRAVGLSLCPLSSHWVLKPHESCIDSLEHLVSLLDIVEIFVWVPLECKLFVCLLDFLFRSASTDTKNLEWGRHVCWQHWNCGLLGIVAVEVRSLICGCGQRVKDFVPRSFTFVARPFVVTDNERHNIAFRC
jgi:hypothetical protein